MAAAHNLAAACYWEMSEEMERDNELTEVEWEHLEDMELLQAAQDRRSRIAAELGRLGGLKGGPARASKLTAEQRSEISRKASRARWHK